MFNPSIFKYVFCAVGDHQRLYHIFVGYFTSVGQKSLLQQHSSKPAFVQSRMHTLQIVFSSYANSKALSLDPIARFAPMLANQAQRSDSNAGSLEKANGFIINRHNGSGFYICCVRRRTMPPICIQRSFFPEKQRSHVACCEKFNLLWCWGSSIQYENLEKTTSIGNICSGQIASRLFALTFTYQMTKIYLHQVSEMI